MRNMRADMEANEDVAALMATFRGANLSDADFAASDTQMRLVEIQEGAHEDSLPLAYDPEAIAAYWRRRPVAVATRIVQLIGIAGGFLSSLAADALAGRLEETQALSIRPDLLSPAAMNEMQKLCDKVPSFDSAVAMEVINSELGRPWQEVYSELTPEPIAAASLGQVYRGRLRATGEEVAVKVQRPYVLETVTVDLYIIRRLGLALRNFPRITQRADVVALLDEWAARFFEELDYVREGENGTRFAESMRVDLPQARPGAQGVVVPRTYAEYTSRRVLTTEWLDGEKLSQSQADDVGRLVNVGVICYLKQLLDTGFFHADPHPGNLIRTPDGRLAILDFGLMTEIDDDIKYGMIDAISHLIHRDYEAIGQDFVALQELAADLAMITYTYPFRIPPYFALIIRAIGVLEGIALVGDPDFAIVDEAFPFISKMLMTDDNPRLREGLRYMVYGRNTTFDADRLIDLLGAFETFQEAASSARGDMDLQVGVWDGVRAVRFVFSEQGAFFRDFLTDEVVKAIDAMSRDQLRALLGALGLQNLVLPVLLPGARRLFVPVAPPLSPEDRLVVDNVAKIADFLAGGSVHRLLTADPAALRELLPLLPGVAAQMAPEVGRKLASRLSARVLRELFV
eukprot:scaffold3.g6706.t1